MSMLAEKRVKEKWCQDPRNTRWSNDKSKYGYRMLQRMGWEEGKGLGSKEEGQKEHVKVKVKRDNRGLGGKRCRDEAWIEHQDAFDQILAGLSAQTASSKSSNPDQREDTPPQATKALLETATESKRLLYRKFLKSKDLSVHSSEDLDCVLGRKRRKTSNPVENEKELSVAKSESGVSSSDDTGNGITTVTSHLSVKDYFSAKLTATKQKQSAVLVETDGDSEQSLQEQTQYCQKVPKGKTKKRTRNKVAVI